MSVKLTSDVSVPSATAKLVVLICIGVIAGLLAGLYISWETAPLVAWDTIVLGFTLVTWRRILKFTPELVKKHALREDPGRTTSDVILLVASVASLGSVAVLLASASQANPSVRFSFAALGVLSVVASWLVVHTVYALKYAELYFTTPEGGVDFGDGLSPIYQDFAYLAFTLGMTYQVSDTTLRSREFRVTALKHALLSFLLGTVIIATTINLVAGLGK